MILPAEARCPSLSDHHPAHKITDSPFDSVGPLLLIGWAEVGVRHEALFDRVEVEGLHPLSVVAGGVKLGAV
jgi:hypothetical protein